jgi:drug/metabolite transporter (DMT)-like permease
MTGAEATGIALALAAAAAFEGSYVLQALEARRAAPAERPRLGLLAGLVRRPVWVVGIGLSGLAFALQVLALRDAPLSVVQPVLALGLVALLALSRVVLGERVGGREVLGAAGVIGGVIVLVLAAPQRTGDASTLGLAAAGVALATVLVAPFARRSNAPGRLVAAATAGDALAALAVNEVARELTARPPVAAAWAALAALAGLLALTAETTALQRSPATVVAPVVLAGQIAIPVALAPLVAGESWAATPGGGVLVVAGLAVVVAAVAVLARSPGVGRLHRPGAGPQLPEDGASASTRSAASGSSGR